ncbi:MAG TPA: hypothetical protein DCZ94_03620 [Lentisphaeria bacterium]|nr:hypothetical protein [Lentisphaeria bacterium]
MLSSGKDVLLVPDLCRIAAKDKALLKKVSSSGELAVVACFPRAVKALFAYAGIDKKVKLHVFNMRTSSSAEILSKLKVHGSRSQNETVKECKPDKKSWIPWFPAIEYGRCVNCKQCLSFCLFGVYKLSKDGKVIVAKPENCKTNCPACAKVCPKSAIIFPKYTEAPVNGGEVDENAPAGKNMRIDYEKLLADDTYAFLHQRRLNAMKAAQNGTGAQPAGKTRLLKKAK